MRLVKFSGEDGPVYVNPEHVVAVRKALRDTKIETLSGPLTIKEEVAVAVRLLGADELAIDITPALPEAKKR